MFRVTGRFACAITLICLFTGISAASSFSFAETFQHDDDRQNFTFTTPSGSVTIRTWSYAGGTNALGSLIPSGGFDPILSVFDSTGGLAASSLLIASNDDPGCGGVDPDPSTLNCFDAKLVLTTLDASHTYTVVLTESFNTPNGPDYGSGFAEDGLGDFTAGAFGCGASQFCDATPAIRNGQWAVDITGVRDAAQDGVPEPGSILTVATGLCAGLLLRRRTRTITQESRWR